MKLKKQNLLIMFTKKTTHNVQKSIISQYQNLEGFEIMRLRDFLNEYLYEIHKSFLFYNMKKRNYYTPYEIFVLVDCLEYSKTTMTKNTKKKYNRSNKKRKQKMQEQYHYSNLFNRIHGYLILEDLSDSEDTPISKKVVSLSVICSSSYSNKKGIGSCLMKFMKEICKQNNFTDIVLEVSNEIASGIGYEEDYYSDYDSDYDSEEEYFSSREIYNDFMVERLTKEFFRKALRHRINGEGFKEAYYNVGDEYIEKIIYSYLNDIKYNYEFMIK